MRILQRIKMDFITDLIYITSGHEIFEIYAYAKNIGVAKDELTGIFSVEGENFSAIGTIIDTVPVIATEISSLLAASIKRQGIVTTAAYTTKKTEFQTELGITDINTNPYDTVDPIVAFNGFKNITCSIIGYFFEVSF